MEISSPAQTSVNVTNYGAVGNAVQFYVSTLSNSVVVVTTNTLSAADIGKTMEVFQCGPRTFGENSYGTNAFGNQDMIATITNVVNGTNIYLNQIVSNTLAKAFATYGTDNTVPFSNAMAAVSGSASAVINIPNGRYLLMPLERTGANGYAYAAIVLRRGGLTYRGESQTNTVLLSAGAWRILNYQSVVYPFRGFLFEIQAPITNDLPLVFENMTWDGGVQSGYLDVQGIACNQVDGLGWDQQHSAYLLGDAGSKTGSATQQILTNLTVTHWRGEMIKSIDQNTNGNIAIKNCLFADGNATALNVYPSWDVRNNTFSNLFMICEYGQDYRTNTSYFCNNFSTNIWGNGFTLNVVNSWNLPAFIMQSNTFWFNSYAGNGIQTSPGVNVYMLDNQIHCANYMNPFVIGGAGSQGTLANTNIVIAGNTVSADANNPTFPGAFGHLGNVFSWGGPGVTAVYGLTISNNTILSPETTTLIYAGSYSSNVRVVGNNFGTNQIIYISTVGGGLFPLFEDSNVYTPYPFTLGYQVVQTNLVSYGDGPIKRLDYVTTSNIFVLQDTNAFQIPAGAKITIDNRTNRWTALGNGSSGDVLVYPSQTMLNRILLRNGEARTFQWNNGVWRPLFNPAWSPNLRVIVPGP